MAEELPASALESRNSDKENATIKIAQRPPSASKTTASLNSSISIASPMTKKKSPKKVSPSTKGPPVENEATSHADDQDTALTSPSPRELEAQKNLPTSPTGSNDKKRKHEETETNNNSSDASDNDNQKHPAADDHDYSGSPSNAESTIAAAKASPLDLSKPIKRARTAYFIFCDEHRGELKAKHKSVAGFAKELGQMWSQLSAEDKGVYSRKAAAERERVAKQLEQFTAAGGDISKLPGAATLTDNGSQHLILPLARIRKICRLDPDVKNLSKEAMLLVTKCAELATCKLGIETVHVAQIQNRRTLLAEDVAQVCATREQFLFLRDDVKDLVREQMKQKEATAGGGKRSAAAEAASSNSRPMTSYFAKK